MCNQDVNYRWSALLLYARLLQSKFYIIVTLILELKCIMIIYTCVYRAKMSVKCPCHHHDIILFDIFQRIGAYLTSKAAILSMVNNLAVELQEKNIKINCVAPGIFRTRMGGPVSIPCSKHQPFV